jgi:hypothetical protein
MLKMINNIHPLQFLEHGLMDYDNLCQLDIFREGMCQNSICINYPPNSCHRIENKKQFHGNLGITFHAQLGHSLFKIKMMMIK